MQLAYDPVAMRFDLAPAGQGSDLVSLTISSLLTWARAEEGDELPDFSNDRRGPWASAWPRTPGRVTGSRLWLLQRAIVTDPTVGKARRYAEEALAWMTTDGLVSATRVEAWRGVNELYLRIIYIKPDGSEEVVDLPGLWGQLGRAGS